MYMYICIYVYVCIYICIYTHMYGLRLRGCVIAVTCVCCRCYVMLFVVIRNRDDELQTTRSPFALHTYPVV